MRIIDHLHIHIQYIPYFNSTFHIHGYDEFCLSSKRQIVARFLLSLSDVSAVQAGVWCFHGQTESSAQQHHRHFPQSQSRYTSESWNLCTCCRLLVDSQTEEKEGGQFWNCLFPFFPLVEQDPRSEEEKEELKKKNRFRPGAFPATTAVRRPSHYIDLKHFRFPVSASCMTISNPLPIRFSAVWQRLKLWIWR